MAKIAFIGLGNMGTPMSINLVKAGHEVTVWNRTKSKADEVLAEGAKWADSPKAAMEVSDILITMVADGPTLQKVALGEDGYVQAMKPGDIAIDMSTVAPAESLVVNEAIEAAGCKFMRAPVTGSTILAKSGQIGILASGDKDTYDKVLPLFEIMGGNQFYLGGAEEARVMKLCLNIMIATTNLMTAEAVVLAEKSGLDLAQAYDVIAGSVVGSPFVKYKVGPVVSGNYAPAFSVKLMMKDVDLAFAAAKDAGVALPTTALTRQYFAAAAGAGYGDNDISVLTKVLEEQCGYKRA